MNTVNAVGAVAEESKWVFDKARSQHAGSRCVTRPVCTQRLGTAVPSPATALALRGHVAGPFAALID